MKQKTKNILIIVGVCLVLIALITFKTVKNFERKAEVTKQKEIVRLQNEEIVKEINDKIFNIDIDKLTLDDKKYIFDLYNNYLILDKKYKSKINGERLEDAYYKIRELEKQDIIDKSPEEQNKIKRINGEVKKLPPLNKVKLEDSFSINMIFQMANELSDNNKKQIDFEKIKKYKEKIEKLKRK